MTYQHLQILLPTLNQAALAAEQPALPPLRQLLRIANRLPNAHSTYPEKLASLFKLKNKLPTAALLAKQYNHYQPNKWYLVAEPCELKADLATVYCLGKDHLELTEDDAEMLAAGFLELLPESIKLLKLQPDCWLLESDQSLTLRTLSLDDVEQKTIPDNYLSGDAAGDWRRLQTELQMLWHQSAINQQRRAQGAAEINSVWFSGEGELHQAHETVWQYVWADDDMTRGLANHMQCDSQSLENFQLPTSGSNWHGLLAINNFTKKNIEFIFSSIWNALKSKQLKAVSIWHGGETNFQITHHHRWRVWRRQQPITHYLKLGQIENVTTEND